MSRECKQNPEEYARLYLASMRDEIRELRVFLNEVSAQDLEQLMQPPYKLPSRSQRLIIINSGACDQLEALIQRLCDEYL